MLLVRYFVVLVVPKIPIIHQIYCDGVLVSLSQMRDVVLATTIMPQSALVLCRSQLLQTLALHLSEAVLPWPAMLRMPVAASENIFDRLQNDFQLLHDAF